MGRDVWFMINILLLDYGREEKDFTNSRGVLEDLFGFEVLR